MGRQGNIITDFCTKPTVKLEIPASGARPSVGIAWPTSEGRPVLGRQGGKFKEKTFPRLVQTGEGSSLNSTGTKFVEKPLPWLLQMGEGSSINSIPNKTQHKILETRVMVKFVKF